MYIVVCFWHSISGIGRGCSFPHFTQNCSKGLPHLMPNEHRTYVASHTCLEHEAGPWYMTLWTSLTVVDSSNCNYMEHTQCLSCIYM
jgi:hypothetical protein